jgi:hypothetical protein
LTNRLSESPLSCQAASHHVEVVEGDAGEFSVLVGDRIVARKAWLRFPSDERVLEAVRTALNR